MDKHFSDVKDRFYVRYDKNRPKESRALIKDQYAKLKVAIENEFLHVLCPHKDVIVNKELPIHLTTIALAFNKDEGRIAVEELAAVKVARMNVERLASDYGLTLPKRYSWTIADIYRKAGDAKTGIEIINAALTGTKSDANLHSVKAHILRDQGNLEGAVESLDQAIALYPEVESFWHNKALCLEKLGRTSEALSSYEKAVAADSTCSSVYFHFGILLYQAKDFERAKSAFSKAEKNDPGARHIQLWKARNLDKAGNTQDAIAILTGLTSSDPNDSDALFALALITENEEEELHLLDKVVQLVPNHSGAICSRAAVLSNLGRHDEALQFLNKSAPSCSEYPTCVTILTTIAITLSKLGRISDAISAAEKLLSVDPKNSVGRSVKAYCCSKAGRPEEGVSILEQLAAEGPMNAPCWYDLSCCYAALGQVDQVLRCLTRAIELDKSVIEHARSDRSLAAVRNSPAFLAAFDIWDSQN
jgi:tetratricopeptide (TPR) repeat protein